MIKVLTTATPVVKS